MNLCWTKKYIYKKCADRISNKIREKDVTLKEIYPSNEKIISRITNCKIGSKNPYLIQDAVLSNYCSDENGNSKNVGIIPILGFENAQEVLWGTASEIRVNIPEIFQNIIYDLILCNSELDVNVYDIVCDYVSYAKYSTYWRLLYDTDHSVPAFYYGLFEDDVLNNLDSAREAAINYLFFKPQCKEVFTQAFIDFASTTCSFKKLDDTLTNNLIYPAVIPLLKRYIPDNNSLGLRVKNIIEADISQKKALVFIPPEFKSPCEKLILISGSYISELELFQEEYISHTDT